MLLMWLAFSGFAGISEFVLISVNPVADAFPESKSVPFITLDFFAEQ